MSDLKLQMNTNVALYLLDVKINVSANWFAASSFKM